MSSTSRAGPRGGKGAAKATDTSGSGSKQKTDSKSDTPKPDNPKTQPTAEQMRIAQIIDTRTEDPDMKNKIKQVMEMTRKSEDEVVTALHDCDNDLDRAVNMLLEGEAQGEWVTSGNKKKNRHPGGTVSSTTRGDKSDNNRDRSEPGETGPDRERSRNRGGPPRMRGRGSSDSRGWRGRENKENEKNLQEGESGRDGGPPRRGARMTNGPGRSGRGGRGGRSGPRTFQSREKGGQGFPRSIDTWNPQGDGETGDASANGPDFGAENWNDDFPSPEDWDNEEYTGTLAETKVFTPSANSQLNTGVTVGGMGAGHDVTSVLPNSSVNANSLENAASMLPQSLTSAGMPVVTGQQASKTLTSAQTQFLNQLTQASLATESLKAAVGIGSSSVATNGTKEPVSYVSAVNSGGAYPVSYAASAYGTPSGTSAPSYSSQIKGNSAAMSQPQPRTKPQRIRVPPPSKIPSSAVEMPGDASSSMSFLDVQFGALEFGSDSNSFDFTSNNTASSEASGKYPPSTGGSGLDNSSGVSLDLASMGMTKSASQQQVQGGSQQQSQQSTAGQVTGLESYASAGSGQPGGTASVTSLSSASQHSKELGQQAASLSAIAHSQKLGGTDSMTFPSQVSDHKSQQASVASSYSQSRSGSGPGTTGSSAVDMVKSEPSSTSSLSYSNSSSSNANTAYQQSYQKPSSMYQSTSNYSSSAVNTGGGGGYSQGSSSGATQYQAGQQSQNSGYTATQTAYVSQAFPASSTQPPTTSYSQTSGNTSYHQSQSATGYQSSTYPSMSQPSVSSTYQSSQQYQTVPQQPQQQGQPSYSAGAGTTSYAPATGSSAASQYQSTAYGSNGPVTTSTSLHAASSASAKLGTAMGSTASKDSQYDVPSTVSSSSLTSATVQGTSSVTPSSLGLVSSAGQTSTNVASTKVTSSTTGVPPAMMSQHQYIMGQQGMPFYNVQQPIYGFEDYQHQLMQSRVPMQTSGFYDLSSLAAGRESGMTSVAYSVSDGRFARTDNNSSPVPSTLSQQNPTQAHQQPMLNPTTLPPGYAYFYGTGVVPGSFQYGTPTLYQLPTATNAHGATNSTQYAKPATYSSAYGSGYDSLSGQGTADYSKTSGGYAASQGGQSTKGSVVGSAGSSTSAAATASDLTSNMYGKTHVTLGKVNSYDKQGFHSGTPPPFSLPASQTSQIGAAGYTPLFIPTLAPHQQIHQPLHQDSSSGTGQRSQPTSQQSKTGVKQPYNNASYWAQN